MEAEGNFKYKAYEDTSTCCCINSYLIMVLKSYLEVYEWNGLVCIDMAGHMHFFLNLIHLI